jgi:excisionase family DNA binding protein
VSVFFSALDKLATFKRLITASELAELLGCNRMTVYRLVKSGYISCYRLRGSILFEPKEIAEYLHAREVR